MSSLKLLAETKPATLPPVPVKDDSDNGREAAALMMLVSYAVPLPLAPAAPPTSGPIGIDCSQEGATKSEDEEEDEEGEFNPTL